MTAKEELHRRIDEMSDEEAELVLELLTTTEAFEFAPLSTEDIVAINSALLQELDAPSSRAERSQELGS